MLLLEEGTEALKLLVVVVVDRLFEAPRLEEEEEKTGFKGTDVDEGGEVLPVKDPFA